MLPQQMFDLSVQLGPSSSEILPVNIQRWSHVEGGSHLADLAGIDQDKLPGGMGWASERVDALTHSGTHMDAPYHYSPTCKGTASRTIDEVPIEWCFGPGMIVDVSSTNCDEAVTPEEFTEAENAFKRKATSGDIILFHTGAEEQHGSDRYILSGRALSPELISLLCARGVKIIGTDAWSIDPYFGKMRDNIQKEGIQTVWCGHFVGRKEEFCILERLTNLRTLPRTEFWVACFPVKVAGGSAAWTRVVALTY
jgi:kynurenine formamidase